MSKTPMEIYLTHETPDVEGAVNAVHAHALREALEEVLRPFLFLRTDSREFAKQFTAAIANAERALLNASPGSGGQNLSTPDSQESPAAGRCRGEAPNNAAGQELPAESNHHREGEATHGGLVMQKGRSQLRRAGTRADILSGDASAQQPAPAAPSTSPDAASSDQPGIAQDDGREKEGSTPSGRAPSTAGDPIQRGDPVSKNFPPATTNAAPQSGSAKRPDLEQAQGDDTSDTGVASAAAAPSGPTESELAAAKRLMVANRTSKYHEQTRCGDDDTCARAVIRWKEQSK